MLEDICVGEVKYRSMSNVLQDINQQYFFQNQYLKVTTLNLTSNMQLRQIVVLATWLAFASAIPIAAPEPEPLPYCITIGSRKRGNCRRDDGSIEKRSPIAEPEVDQVMN